MAKYTQDQLQSMDIEELVAKIHAEKATEREAAATRAVLEAELIKVLQAEGVDVTKESYSDEWLFNGLMWSLQITPAVKYVANAVQEALKDLSPETFGKCFRVTYEFSKSGFNAVVKGAEKDFGKESAEADKARKIIETYVETKYTRPTVNVTILDLKKEGAENEG